MKVILILFLSFICEDRLKAQGFRSFAQIDSLFTNRKLNTPIVRDTLSFYNKSLFVTKYRELDGLVYYISDNYTQIDNQLPSSSLIIEQNGWMLVFNFKYSNIIKKEDVVKISASKNDTEVYTLVFYQGKLEEISKFWKSSKGWNESRYLTKSEYGLDNLASWILNVEDLCNQHNFLCYTCNIISKRAEMELLDFIFK